MEVLARELQFNVLVCRRISVVRLKKMIFVTNVNKNMGLENVLRIKEIRN